MSSDAKLTLTISIILVVGLLLFLTFQLDWIGANEATTITEKGQEKQEERTQKYDLKKAYKFFRFGQNMNYVKSLARDKQEILSDFDLALDSPNVTPLLAPPNPYTYTDIISDVKFYIKPEFASSSQFTDGTGLFRLSFVSEGSSADYFDSELEKAETFADTIKAKFGKADWRREINLLDISPGYYVYLAKWNIKDKKRIRVGMFEEDFKFYAYAEIGYLPVVKEQEEEQEKEKEEATEESSKGF